MDRKTVTRGALAVALVGTLVFGLVGPAPSKLMLSEKEQMTQIGELIEAVAV